jgi:hypothetical protein
LVCFRLCFSTIGKFSPLKGQCHEIVCFRFFSWITFPQAPENNIRVIAAGINDTGSKFATSSACVVDTGGKFAIGVIDTGGKFAAGVNDAGQVSTTSAAGVVDTGGN